jgi:hypothetical protein
MNPHRDIQFQYLASWGMLNPVIVNCPEFLWGAPGNQKQVVDRVPDTALEAESGFHWLPFDKLELQVYNIRHIQ